MNKLEWIFLDFDGTLVDSIFTLYEVYNEFLKEFGFNGKNLEFKKLNGPNLFEIVSYLKKKYNLKQNENKLLENYNKKIEFVYRYKIQPKKGAEDLLKFLKNNYKLALVTSSSRKIIDYFLDRNNWRDYFSIIVCGDEIKNSKPHSDIYELCLKRSNTNKNQVLVIEDSKNGFESAINAGLKCEIVNDINSIKKIISDS